MLQGSFRLCLLVAIALLVASCPTYASAVTYTTQSSWAAAVSTAITTVSLSGLAPANGSADFSNSTGLAASGVDIVGYQGAIGTGNYYLKVLDENYQNPWYDWGSPATLEGPQYYNATTPLPFIRVNLAANTTAFGINLMSAGQSGLQYSIALSDGETFNVTTASRPTQTFFGLTNATAISYADFTLTNVPANTAAWGLMSNLQYATTAGSGGSGGGTSDTPEACTLILIGSGLMGMRVFRKRLNLNFFGGATA